VRTVDVSMQETIPILEQPAKPSEVLEDPVKEQAPDLYQRDVEGDDEEPLVHEEDDSMCQAAEAQLLTEAGLEPIPADFAVTPVKKLPRATHRYVRSPDKDLLEEVADESSDTDSIAGDEDAKDDTSGDLAQHPVFEDIEPPKELENMDGDADPTGIAGEPEIIATEESSFPLLAVSYPSIDIFGLDDCEVESPPKAQQDESVGHDQASGHIQETFAISLNDETVNLGALLSRNDNLSAIITDDMIELEVAEADDGDEESLAPVADAMTEQKEDDSPADSPDELSMDLDATETVIAIETEAFTHLEDDKAKLSSFLRRVAEAKVKKSASTSKRESLQNRRDSDVVRKALASPRQALEDKDPNKSPQRSSHIAAESTLDLDQVLASPLVKPLQRPARAIIENDDDDEPDELSEMQTGSPRRRSSRSTRSKLPQFSNQSAGATPNKISVRTDGGEKVNLNRTEAQQLADLVKRNTKKNKGMSISAPMRLAKLKLESLATVVDGELPVVEKLLKPGVKNVMWREQLTEYSTSTATADLEAAASVAGEEGSVKAEPKKRSGSGTPKMRRLKGLGAANGTSAKNVFQSISLPDEIEEEKQAKNISASSVNAKKKRSITTLAIVPSSDEATVSTLATEDDKKSVTAAQKKSKLQPPKKLNLTPSLTSIGGMGSSLPVLHGKENTLFAGLNSPAKKLTKIPAPAVSGIPALPVKRARSGLSKKI
jgi:hypothetical protein